MENVLKIQPLYSPPRKQHVFFKNVVDNASRVDGCHLYEKFKNITKEKN